MTATGSTMTKTERNDLARLIRHRERLMKTAASQRAAELLADFERQLGTIYSFDDDEIWKAAALAVDSEVEAAKTRIAERCRELGIPKTFAPTIGHYWQNRGENSFKERRTELRKMATTKIAALEKAARTKIENHSVEAQTALIAEGLTSDAAKAFLDQLPSPESLMPPLDAQQITSLLKGTSS